MKSEKRSKNPTITSNRKVTETQEHKFKLVSCPVDESFCHTVLNEINELYAKSEIARINKEYLKSVSLLEEAFEKTNELNQKHCLVCADLFKYHINKTFSGMKEELHEISHGIFGSKSYRLAYAKLNNKNIQ